MKAKAMGAISLDPWGWPIPFWGEALGRMTADFWTSIASVVLLLCSLVTLRTVARRERKRRAKARAVKANAALQDVDRTLALLNVEGKELPKAEAQYQCGGCNAIVGPFDKNCPRCGANFA